MQDGRYDCASSGAGIGLGTKTELAGNDQGAQLALGKIIFGRDQRVFNPMKQALAARGKCLTRAGGGVDCEGKS